jgi:hypothetical protein
MSGCALRRWGGHSTNTYRPETGAAKEMAQRLASMQQERAQQDSMWSATEPAATPSKCTSADGSRPSPSSSRTGSNAPS